MVFTDQTDSEPGAMTAAKVFVLVSSVKRLAMEACTYHGTIAIKVNVEFRIHTVPSKKLNAFPRMLVTASTSLSLND